MMRAHSSISILNPKPISYYLSVSTFLNKELFTTPPPLLTIQRRVHSPNYTKNLISDNKFSNKTCSLYPRILF